LEEIGNHEDGHSKKCPNKWPSSTVAHVNSNPNLPRLDQRLQYSKET